MIFGLRERTGFTVDARALSDGTLRTLAILTALETVQEGSRVIVEEFDNGLHPSRVGVLTEAISDATKRRNLDVLVTTHNPATMNNLTDEQMKGVVLCTWSQTKEAADLVELTDLPRFDELLERGQLGDLVSRRVVEQYLAPEFEDRPTGEGTEVGRGSVVNTLPVYLIDTSYLLELFGVPGMFYGGSSGGGKDARLRGRGERCPAVRYVALCIRAGQSHLGCRRWQSAWCLGREDAR